MPRLYRLYNEVLDEDNKARTRTISNAVNKIRLRNEEAEITSSKDIQELETFEIALNNFTDEVSTYMNNLLLTKETITSKADFNDKVYKDNIESLIKLSKSYNQVGRILRRIYQRGEGNISEVRLLKDKLKESGIIGNLDRIKGDLKDLQERTGLYARVIPFVDRIYVGVETAQFPDLSMDKSLLSLTGLSKEEAREARIKRYEERERKGELIPDVLKELGIKDDALTFQKSIDLISPRQAQDLFAFYANERNKLIARKRLNEARYLQQKIKALSEKFPEAVLDLDDERKLPRELGLLPNALGFGRSGGSQTYYQNNRTERFPARNFSPLTFHNATLRRYEV